MIILKLTALMLILAGGFSACEKKDDLPKAYLAEEGRIDINETEFVRMYFSLESGFTNFPAELIIENHTKGVLGYGTYFSVEYFDNENWTEIQLDIAFEAIGLGLFPGEIHEGQFYLLSFEKHNKSKKGRYRFIKNFGLSYDFSYGGIDHSFNLYIEFEIK